MNLTEKDRKQVQFKNNGHDKSNKNNNELPTNLGFRYIWPVKVQLRQLGSNGENTILHISPKFATVYEHVSFQWTLKMHGTPETEEDDGTEEEGCEKKGAEEEQQQEQEDEESYSSAEKGYVAISLYYLDGPVQSVQLKAQVRIAGERAAKVLDLLEEKPTPFLEESIPQSVCVSRGHECELTFKDRAHFSDIIRQNLGRVIRLSLMLEMDSPLFRAETYLNAVSPTPIHSFLTANYRARASSKIWRKCSTRRPRSASDGHPLLRGNKKLDLDRLFNRVMERERERREVEKSGSRRTSRRQSLNEGPEEEESSREVQTQTGHQTDSPSASNLLAPPVFAGQQLTDAHLFKKLLIACCDSCERRASLVPLSMCVGSGTEDECEGREEGGPAEADKEGEEEDKTETEAEEEEGGTQTAKCDGDIPFECDEENKAEIHDTLANMYFNKIVLPDMEYVEDFIDFLIDAELNDLPVLKRACERYLCGELNTKKELMTSLILDLFFIAMVFKLPVMKSMTLTELCERYSELENVGELLKEEEYRSLDKRIQQLCGDRNLHDLVDECKRFREQCLRTQRVELSNSRKVTPLNNEGERAKWEKEGQKNAEEEQQQQEDDQKWCQKREAPIVQGKEQQQQQQADECALGANNCCEKN